MAHSDEHWMSRCLELAALGLGSTAPNPLVGSVIVHQGKLIGEGAHRVYGGPHAEVNAINSVQNQKLLKETTIYVNLEPCSHHGKTPPCADLILQHRIPRVVIAHRDPNPLVAGKGIERLEAAGVEVVVGIREEEARTLNRRFLTYMDKDRPYLILKWAESADGFMDPPREPGEKGSKAVSSPESRKLVHLWRSQEAGILVGAGTVQMDDPELNVRLVKGKNPVPIVLDRHGMLTPDHKVFRAKRTILLSTSQHNFPEGVTCLSPTEFPNDRILMQELKRQGIQSILVEGGKRTLENFLAQGLWDEIRVIRSQKSFGDGLTAPSLIHFSPQKTEQYGSDLVITYRNEL